MRFLNDREVALSPPGIDLVDVAVTLSESNSDESIEAVRAGRLDLALVGYAGDRPDGLDVIDIVREDLIAIVPPGHELDRDGELTVGRLAAGEVVCLPAGTGIRTAFDRTCALHGVEADVTCEASSGAAVVALAARGLGVGVLSESMVADEAGGIRVRRLRGRTVPASLALIRHPTSPNPAVPPAYAACVDSFDLSVPT